MDQIFKILLYLHIAAGFSSIILFWVPMLSKKGGNIHIASGKLYVYAMWAVVISAAILCIENTLTGSTNSAIFLGFISILTGAPLFYAINILKHKDTTDDAYAKRKFILDVILVCYAIAMLIYGITLDTGTAKILMFIFSILGLTTMPKVVRYLRKKPSPYNWIQEHAIGMITTGIAAYTAFLVFGGSKFFGHWFTGYSSIILWTAPGVIGTIANFYYGNKLATKKRV